MNNSTSALENSLLVKLALMPRGRPPKRVDPNASHAARLGAALRDCRAGRNLTLAGLADLIGYTSQHISEIELGNGTPSERFVRVVDDALEAGGGLLALHPAVVIEQVVARQKRADCRRGALPSIQEADDVKRRAFLGLGLAVVLLGPEAAARASRDDWDRIAHAWSHEVATAPDATALLPGLAADLKRLHANGGPQRTVAQLSSYVAGIAIGAGDPVMARRWWRRARAAAVAAGDNHLVAYVVSRQAVQGLYGAYSPQQAVMLADEALAATRVPCTGRVKAQAAKAQALAILGRQRPTADALVALERTFNRLPSDVTRDKLSEAGWPEERLHHVRSYCGMFAGRGETAREEALRLYSKAAWIGPAQVKLHRAASAADPQDAVTTLTGLSEVQRRNRFVRTIARQALAACEARDAAGTAELREVLA